MNQTELQKIAEKCELSSAFRWGEPCSLCYYYGDDEPEPCCATCTRYPTCEQGQKIAETRCKRECEEIAKRKEVLTPA